MFCTECGHKLNGIEEFCPECGHKKEQTNNKDTFSEQLVKNNSLKPILEKIKKCILTHKKIFIAVCSFFIIAFLGVALFTKFYDFTKISWNEKYLDYKIEYCSPSTLNLVVDAYDKEKNKITDITFSSDNGEIKASKNEVFWTLPKESGTYKLTAKAPSGKKIVKTVTVVNLEEGQALGGMIPEKKEKKQDSDGDGLSDEEEEKLGTDKYSADTDHDDLTDYIEVSKTKTDPLKIDTDGDGVHDGDEIDLGLNPLKNVSKDDGINDKDRTLKYLVKDDKSKITIEIEGKGNISSATVDVFSNETFETMDKILNKVYNFYTTGTLNYAKVTIPYDKSELKKKNINEDDIIVYYFNEEKLKLEPIETTIDKKNQKVIVTLKHFSKYVIGSKDASFENNKTNISFVIDNSASMYTEEQVKSLGLTCTGCNGNDSTFKRINLSSKLVDMFGDNYNYHVSKFSGNLSIESDWNSDTKKVKQAINNIKNDFNKQGTNTNIVNALESGIAQFNSKKGNRNNNYMILMTDGENNIGDLKGNMNSIISKATNNNVKICIIGLGKVDTKELTSIANQTGCSYYHASDDSALDEIYSKVGANINYNYVDTDNDKKIDGVVIAETNFLIKRDGFSFANFSSDKSKIGHCYGMATFAMLYYKNELPLQLGELNTSTLIKRNYNSNGYNLENTYFQKQNNLYDFKIKNKALYRYLYNDLPSDYRDRIEDNIFKIKQEYYEELKTIGMKISEVKNKDKDTKKKFKKYESALLTIDNETLNNAVSKDDAQVLNAIWRLFILQNIDKRTYFSSESDEAWLGLLNKLNSDIPIVLTISSSHAVNAIRIIQDINDANKFKLEIYDNNYPGESKYITITRSKYSKFTLNFAAWRNEYNYQFNYNDKDVDLAFNEIEL